MSECYSCGHWAGANKIYCSDACYALSEGHRELRYRPEEVEAFKDGWEMGARAERLKAVEALTPRRKMPNMCKR